MSTHPDHVEQINNLSVADADSIRTMGTLDSCLRTEARRLRGYAEAMSLLGMQSGDNLYATAEALDAIAAKVSAVFGRGISARLEDAQAATGNMLQAALASCTASVPNKKKSK